MNNLLSILFLLLIFQPKILLAESKLENALNSNWISLKNNEEIGRYFRKDDIIYVHVNGMISEELKNADSASFEVNKISGEFGKDKSHVWYIALELDVDASSWEILSQTYSKDKNNVYCGLRKLPEADPKTFKVIKNGLAEWGADKTNVYNQWFQLENSDPSTFQFIDISFSKDKNNVYYNQNKLENADPISFVVIKQNVGKDKNAVFAFGSRMPSYIDIPSVRVPGDGYIYDKNGKYYLFKEEWIKVDK